MPRRFLDLLLHIIIAVQVKYVGDKVEGVLIVLDFSIESSEIEPVCEVVFIYFAKILVAT